MPFTDKDKELISVGASIAAGCKKCTEFHVDKARRCGATDEEIELAMTDALLVRRGAEAIMERHGLKVLGRKLLQLGATDLDEGADPPGVSPTRIGELVAVAAAFAVNCETSLAQHIAAAPEVGATEEEIEATLQISKFIKGKADSYCCKWI